MVDDMLGTEEPAGWDYHVTFLPPRPPLAVRATMPPALRYERALPAADFTICKRLG